MRRGVTLHAWCAREAAACGMDDAPVIKGEASEWAKLWHRGKWIFAAGEWSLLSQGRRALHELFASNPPIRERQGASPGSSASTIRFFPVLWE